MNQYYCHLIVIDRQTVEFSFLHVSDEEKNTETFWTNCNAVVIRFL